MGYLFFELFALLYIQQNKKHPGKIFSKLSFCSDLCAGLSKSKPPSTAGRWISAKRYTTLTLNSTIFRNFRCGLFCSNASWLRILFLTHATSELAIDQYVSICEFPIFISVPKSSFLTNWSRTDKLSGELQTNSRTRLTNWSRNWPIAGELWGLKIPVFFSDLLLYMVSVYFLGIPENPLFFRTRWK